jgi:TM2 domain-containing membrane protein YozV
MIALSVIALLYFLPTLLAVRRGHAVTGILLCNLFFGWTGIGWFAMLLWALLSYPPYGYAYYYPYPPPHPPANYYNYPPNDWRR